MLAVHTLAPEQMIIMNAQQRASRRETVIEPTRHTPFVYCSSNSLMIKGNSMAEDMLSFYAPIIEDFKQSVANNSSCEVELCFESMNTSTAKILFDLFKYLRGMKAKGIRVSIKWTADASNEDMIETGHDYSELFELDFKVSRR